MNLTIYGHPESPYCLRVHYFLAELGASFEYRAVQFNAAGPHDDAFRTLAPYGRVPVLVWDDLVLAESHAILRYLSARLQATAWYPAELSRRALIDQCLDFAGYQLGSALDKLAWQRFWLPHFGRACDPNAEQTALRQALRDLPCLEQALQQHPYLAGVSPSLADISFLPMARCAELARFDLQAYPLLWTWYGAMRQRPAWREVARHQAAHGLGGLLVPPPTDKEYS